MKEREREGEADGKRGDEVFRRSKKTPRHRKEGVMKRRVGWESG